MIEFARVVSGVPVTKRGVHGCTTAYAKDWLGDNAPWGGRDHWLNQLKAMGMSWLVLLDRQGSVLEQFGPRGLTVVEHVLEAGCQPIIRYQGTKLPRPFTDKHIVKELVRIYSHYGCTPFYIPWNEPGNYREWVKERVPRDYLPIFYALWNEAAWQVLEAGAYVGFPDLPDYDFDKGMNPFADTDRRIWETRKAWVALHCYKVNRPWNYPHDAASQTGKPLTEAEWRAALDDYWGDPVWMAPGLERINQARREAVEERERLGLPPPTYLTDPTGWWSWRRTLHWAEKTLGFRPHAAVTEGGDTPDARPFREDRYPPTTPNRIGPVTLQLYNEDSDLFAVNPWVWASGDQGGDMATWESDAWNGWGYSDRYGRVKPVVHYLIANPPHGKIAEARTCLALARGDLTEALDRLARL